MVRIPKNNKIWNVSQDNKEKENNNENSTDGNKEQCQHPAWIKKQQGESPKSWNRINR